MYLIWGDVPVRVNRLLGFGAEAVFDPTGCDYLWTDYTVSVEGLWGRAADGYDFLQMTPEGPVPAFLAGFIGAAQASGTRSVVATRHALSQRSAFVLYELNTLTGQAEVLLASGGVDAANGPVMVEPPAVQTVHGQGALMFIRLTFKTSICDCPLVFDASVVGDPDGYRGGGQTASGPQVVVRSIGSNLLNPDRPKGKPETDDERDQRRKSEFVGLPMGPCLVGDNLALLSVNGVTVCRSNRWTQRIAYDPTNESPIYRIQGQAVFRRDYLQKVIGLASVDQFRGSLIPFMPLNATREINDISVSGDGLTLTYDVTDRVQVRGYLDQRVIPQNNGRAAMLGGVPSYRNVAGVSLVSRRDFNQPGLTQQTGAIIDRLAQAEFAFGERGGGGGFLDDAGDAAKAAGGDVTAAVGLAWKSIKKVLGVVGTAISVADTVMPQTSETVTAEVRLTREGTLADGLALGLALVSGVLDPAGVERVLRGGDRNPVFDRFGGVPPASSVSIEIDHKEGIVRVSQTLGQAGVIDFMLGGQQAAITQMFRPPSDEVIGGRNALGVANLANLFDILGAAALATLFQLLLGRDPKSIGKLIDQAYVNRYSEELLITDADVILRGPNGDSYSRAACDLLIRSAQLLLRPCQTPLGPANLELEATPPRLVVRQCNQTQRPALAPAPNDPNPIGAVLGGIGTIAPPKTNPGNLPPGFPQPPK